MCYYKYTSSGNKTNSVMSAPVLQIVQNEEVKNFFHLKDEYWRATYNNILQYVSEVGLA